MMKLRVGKEHTKEKDRSNTCNRTKAGRVALYAASGRRNIIALRASV